MDAATATSGAVLAGRYALERKLGTGGSAVIWEATDLAQRRRVALKLLDPRLGSRPSSLRQFKREAEVLAELDHPNIARAYELGIDGEQPFLAMELVEGVPLERLLAEHAELDRPFALPEISLLLRQLTAAISHAHSRGIMHRDLKPSNIMLEHRGGSFHVKVIDFGIAKLFEEHNASEGTTRGRRLGSLAYMAPEQARGEAVGPPADIFSIGVILIELLTLKRPWLRDDQGRPLAAYSATVRNNQFNAPPVLMARMASEARPRLSELRPGLDPRLDELAARALAIDPHDRFESAEALAAAFDARWPEMQQDATAAGQVENVDATLAFEVEQALTRATEQRTLIRDTVVSPPPAHVQPRRRGMIIAAAVAAASALVAAGMIAVASRNDPVVPAVVPEATSLEAAAAPRAVKTAQEPARTEAKPAAASEAKIDKPATPRPRQASTTAPAPAPAQIARFSKERARLKQLRENEATASSWIELGESIAKATEQIADPKTRARLQRIARSSAALGDADGVEQVLVELETNLAGGEH